MHVTPAFPQIGHSGEGTRYWPTGPISPSLGIGKTPSARSILTLFFPHNLNQTMWRSEKREGMNRTTSSRLTRGESAASGYGEKTIRNTFAPSCQNEYLDGGMLFQLCKYGLPFEKLPGEGKEMLLQERVSQKVRKAGRSNTEHTRALGRQWPDNMTDDHGLQLLRAAARRQVLGGQSRSAHPGNRAGASKAHLSDPNLHVNIRHGGRGTRQTYV